MSRRILVIPGALRTGSYNRRLAMEATRLLSASDAVVTLLDLKDYPLPIYDGDHESESGIPQNAVLLAQRIAASDGLLLVSPEYNHSLAPVLKNAIDWTSRVRKISDRPVHPFKGLVVALASASPGQFGGMRGLEALRTVMRALSCEVTTAQVSVANAASAFDDTGHLVDDRMRLALETLVDRFLDQTRCLGRHV